MSETPQSSRNPVSVSAFERLRKRAIGSRDYANTYLYGKLSPDIANRPNDFVLTLPEIDAADSMLFRACRESGIEYLNFENFRTKYTQPHGDTVWHAIEESSRLAAMWCDYALVLLDGINEKNTNDVIFNIQNAMNVAENMSISGGNFTQNYGQQFDDLAALVASIAAVRAELRQGSGSFEDDKTLGHLADAEKEAREGKTSGVVANLRKAGSWAFEVATKIGETVAAAAIKSAMDIK